MTIGEGDEVREPESRRFPAAFRGYDATAVDEHIDALARRLRQITAQANARIAELEAALAQARSASGPDTGEGAPPGLSQREEEELEALGKSIAEILRSAHAEANAVRERAAADAQAMLLHAEGRLVVADRRMAEADRARVEAGLAPVGADSAGEQDPDGSQ